jgi:gamma-glutamyltranspeptidase
MCCRVRPRSRVQGTTRPMPGLRSLPRAATPSTPPSRCRSMLSAWWSRSAPAWAVAVFSCCIDGEGPASDVFIDARETAHRWPRRRDMYLDCRTANVAQRDRSSQRSAGPPAFPGLPAGLRASGEEVRAACRSKTSLAPAIRTGARGLEIRPSMHAWRVADQGRRDGDPEALRRARRAVFLRERFGADQGRRHSSCASRTYAQHAGTAGIAQGFTTASTGAKLAKRLVAGVRAEGGQWTMRRNWPSYTRTVERANR